MLLATNASSHWHIGNQTCVFFSFCVYIYFSFLCDVISTSTVCLCTILRIPRDSRTSSPNEALRNNRGISCDFNPCWYLCIYFLHFWKGEKKSFFQTRWRNHTSQSLRKKIGRWFYLLPPVRGQCNRRINRRIAAAWDLFVLLSPWPCRCSIATLVFLPAELDRVACSSY